jgi:glutamyl-tRNA reductase
MNTSSDNNFSAHTLSNFCMIGISFHKANTAVRNSFALNPSTIQLLIEDAKKNYSLENLLVLNTCNRTELYGYLTDTEMLLHLLAHHTHQPLEQLMPLAYIKTGEEAVAHCFKVAAGLDSQILGDYEIAGQIKNAMAQSLHHQMMGLVLERIIQQVLRASKKIRTLTSLSTGTVSVSYAVIEWLNHTTHINKQSIAVVGLGKLGKNVAKNVKQYLPSAHITVCNRTPATAMQLATEIDVDFTAFELINEIVNTADVVISCAASTACIITESQVVNHRPRVFIDLSMPATIDAAIKQLPQQQLIDIDEISAVLHTTLQQRKAAVPAALAIIETFVEELMRWLHTYQHSSAIKHMKKRLLDMNEKLIANSSAASFQSTPPKEQVDKKLHQTVTRLALNLKEKKEKGCQLITAYNDFFTHA